MKNPYQAPKEFVDRPQPPIADHVVMQLIEAGNGVERLAINEVTDCQVYGRKHMRKLVGTMANRAIAAHCEPVVFQTVLWWCLIYIPIRPIAVYFVIPVSDVESKDSDMEQYFGIRARWDSWQIAGHYSILAALGFSTVLTIWGLIQFW